ncbi:MAG: hypothetical protein R2941_14520 [Desulfobacterales bacterium]
MSGWNPVQKSLEKAEVDASACHGAHYMDLFSFGVPIKLILLATKTAASVCRNKRQLRHLLPAVLPKQNVLYSPCAFRAPYVSDMLFREIGLKAGLVGTKEAGCDLW